LARAQTAKDFCEPIAASDEHPFQTDGFRRFAIATTEALVSPFF
jgi:hypothetical protein